MFKDFLCSGPVIDVPVDAGDDEVVVTVSVVKALRTDARTDLLVIVVFSAVAVMRGSVGGMVCVGMLTELGIVMVVATAIALEVFVVVSCVGDVRSGV